MQLFTNNSMLMMERSMNFLWTKQTAILDNIANVETPNYKAKYVTFEETLQQKINSANGNIGQIRNALENTSASVHVAVNEQAKADGNGVDISEQSVELARNAFQQQHVYNAINTELSLLRTAVYYTQPPVNCTNRKELPGERKPHICPKKTLAKPTEPFPKLDLLCADAATFIHSR